MEVERGNVGKQANRHWTKDPYSYDIVFTTQQITRKRKTI